MLMYKFVNNKTNLVFLLQKKLQGYKMFRNKYKSIFINIRKGRGNKFLYIHYEKTSLKQLCSYCQLGNDRDTKTHIFIYIYVQILVTTFTTKKKNR